MSAKQLGDHYQPEYLQERAAVTETILTLGEERARLGPVALIDRPGTKFAEQGLSTVVTSDGEELTAFSIVDTTIIPPLGSIEALAFRRLNSAQSGSQSVERMLGNDHKLNASFSFYGHPGEEVPAITFLIGPDDRGELAVRSAHQTLITKTSKTVPLNALAEDAYSDEFRPTHAHADDQSARDVYERYRDMVNAWAYHQLDTNHVPAFGEQGAFHSPARDFASFKNLQLLSGVLFGKDYPLYTPEQIRQIDTALADPRGDRPISMLETSFEVTSLRRVVEATSPVQLRKAERARLYDLLLDFTDTERTVANERRYGGTVRVLGGVAATLEKIKIPTDAIADTPTDKIAAELIRLVQQTVPAQEGQAAGNRALLAGLVDYPGRAIVHEMMRHTSANHSLVRQVAARNNQRRPKNR